MKKLKKISLFNIIIIFTIIFTIFYVKYNIENNIYKSKYTLSDYYFEGYIKKVLIKENRYVYYINDLIINDYNMSNLYEIGDYVLVDGKIKEPQNSTIPNLFNYKNYLYSINIHYIVDAIDINKNEDKVNFFYNIKKTIYNYLKTYNQSNYMLTFILGENNLDDTIKNSYLNNGISHLFALSGMHITIFTSIFLSLLNKVFKKNISIVIIISFLFFYIFLTNFSKSVIRASFLFIIISLEKIFNRKIDIIRSYIIFVCLILILNPYNIYNSSFLFSYTITLYLILFSSIISKYQNYFIKIFITSLISFLVSLPIIVNINFRINLISVFSNIIFVPLVSLIIFPTALIILFFRYFEFIFDILISFLENLSLFLNKYNINIILCHMNFKYIIIYYIVTTFVLYKIKKNNYNYVVLIIIFILIHYNVNYFKNYTLISYLDVGQGDCTLINLEHNKGTILIDTGGNYNYELSINTIKYLNSLGIKKINYLILTHGDYDHIGEAINLVNNFKVENVIFNSDNYNELEQKLIKVLENKNIKYYKDLKELNIGNDKLYFLNTKEYDNENDNSNVLYFQLNNYKFLFMGDAGITREKEIISNYNLENIDFIKIGHHGSNTSSSEYFIDSIKPKNCLISVGKNNRYCHPKESVLDTLDDYCNIYRTDLNGSIEIKITSSNYMIKSYGS